MGFSFIINHTCNTFPNLCLDPNTGIEVLEVLREVQRTGNQTLIMATHNPQLAALADRRIQLEQLGRADERV